MNVFSKLSRNYTCYELGHTWTRSCIDSCLTVGKSAYIVSFKTYLTIYLISSFLQRKKIDYYYGKMLLEVMRSTVFLGSNGLLFILSFCFWRCLLHLNYLSVGFLPSMLASLFSIFLERKPRRTMLAVYMSTVAIETLYIMAKSRKWVKPLPFGEMWYFAPTMAVYMYLFKQGKLGSTVTSMFKFLLGSSEDNTSPIEKSPKPSGTRRIAQLLTMLFEKLTGSGGIKSHPLCRHSDSCVQYIIEGSIRPFGVGVLAQTLLALISKFKLIFKSPKEFFRSVIATNNLKFGAFLSSFVLLYRISQCLLRHLRNCDSHEHCLLSGWIASWSFLFYRRSTLALHLTTKLVENLYSLGLKAGKLPRIPFGVPLLYSVATSIIFHAMMLEPHNIQPAYWSFIMQLTDGRMADVNRALLDEFGTQASKMRPDFWPNYDPKLTDLSRFTAETFKTGLPLKESAF